jgi:hypothetical protein
MLRRRQTLSETDCYCRCYGPGPGTVRIVRLEPLRRYGSRMTGETLRRMFEDRLDARDPALLYEPEAA